MLKEAHFKLGFTQTQEIAPTLTCVSQSLRSIRSSFRTFGSLLHHIHKNKLRSGLALPSRKAKSGPARRLAEPHREQPTGHLGEWHRGPRGALLTRYPP